MNISKQVEQVVREWSGCRENLLQMLIALQYRLGVVPDQALALLSSHFGISTQEIKGIIDFYSFLDRGPARNYRIFVSDNIVDYQQGSHSIATQLAQALGVEIGLSRAEDTVTIGYSSCIGMSDQGPALLINGRVIPQVDQPRLQQIIDLIKQGKPVTGWPHSLTQVASNIRRKARLLNTGLRRGDALAAFKQLGAPSILQRLEDSGLRGRGGAGFPTASKWRYCLAAEQTERVVVCNADEGEPGTFKDRILLQEYFDRVVEGMLLCASIVKARRGFIYLRGEYRFLLENLQAEIDLRSEHGDFHMDHGQFRLEIHLGAGAYVCGEESALIQSLQGGRGVPAIRPPFPVTRGYLNYPTVVNNVETFVAAAMIAHYGADWFNQDGTAQSAGSKLFSVSGDCRKPGVYELPLGTTLQQVLDISGARNTQAVQVGGASGSLVNRDGFNRGICFEDLPPGGSIMVFDDSRDIAGVVLNLTEFFRHESCGFCTPCRVGTLLLERRLKKLRSGQASQQDIHAIRAVAKTMLTTSHCGLGATASNPLIDLLDNFPDQVDALLLSDQFRPGFDLDGALEEARQLTGRNDEEAHIR